MISYFLVTCNCNQFIISMKKLYLPTLIAGLLLMNLILFNSCSPAYIPNSINTPMLSNKGELQLALNSGVSGFDPQVAYAFSDKFGLMVNGSFDNQTNDSTDNFHKHIFLEAGTGYYTKLGDQGRFEIFGGVGLGKTRGLSNGVWWVSTADANLVRFFIQPGIGFTSSFFDVGLATRFAAVNLRQDTLVNTGLFIEPAITVKAGYKYVKLFLQLGVSFPINSDDIDFAYQPLLISAGLHINLWKEY